jgi:hypothetical protein
MYRIENNQVELKENLLFNIFSEVTNFYSIGKRLVSSLNYELNDKSYLIIYIKLSQQYTNYERTVFTLFDMFGMLGGIFELFSLIGFVLVNRISTNLFNNCLLSSLYQVKAHPSNSSKVVPAKRKEAPLK